MVRIRTVVVALASVSCAAAATPAWADDGAHEKAAAAFRSARADIAAGNCAAAVPKLEESLADEPSVGGHLSMADCYEQVDLVAAWRELQEAADLAAVKSDPRASIARDRAAGLEPRLSMLRFVYAPPQAERTPREVRVDGATIKPLLLEHDTLATTPGAHAIEVSVPGKKTWRGQVVARSAGTTVEVDVVVEDEAVAAPVEPPTPASVTALPSTPPEEVSSSRGSGQRTAGLVTGAVGIAGIAAGAVFGFIALADQGNLRDACGGSVSRCDPPGGTSSVTGPQSSARSAATVSTVAFIAGSVALATGVVLFATAPSGSRVEVGVAGGPGAAGVSFGGMFE